MNPLTTEKPFGNLDSLPVTEYSISNKNGMVVSVINYGAILTKIITADKDGNFGNTLIGFDSVNDYIQNGPQYIGCIVGRYCNRIADAKFSVDGHEYPLAVNNMSNNLHGGIKGFDQALWNVAKKTGNSITLTHFSKDGDEGFPGNLHVEVTYALTEDNELVIDYTARTDKATPVSLTSHCYFNLSAGREPTVLDHELKIFADEYTVLNEVMIPTGEIASVKNRAIDFSTAKKVGRDIQHTADADGYDLNFVLKSQNKAAELYDPSTGRFMEMFTTEPGLQFYSGNYLQAIKTSNNKTFLKHAGLCLEAQHYPNSPNEPSFPNTILRPGEIYRQKTSYKFSVK